MSDPRLKEMLHLLNPGPGKRLWFGGASPLGCLRGVPPEQAVWKPTPDRHSIWELTLHIASTADQYFNELPEDRRAAIENVRRKHEQGGRRQP